LIQYALFWQEKTALAVLSSSRQENVRIEITFLHESCQDSGSHFETSIEVGWQVESNKIVYFSTLAAPSVQRAQNDCLINSIFDSSETFFETL
jgi:hypothetical protein